MATCKDCLHCEACTSMLEAMGYTVDGDGQDANKRCDQFNAVQRELRKVVRQLCEEYEKAKNNPIVHNPIGYALYQTWKKYE